MSPHPGHARLRTRPARIAAGCLGLALGAATLSWSTTSSAQSTPTSDIVLFDDDFRSGFADWSWGDTGRDNAGPVASGSHALRADLAAWGGVSIGHWPAIPVPLGATVDFTVHGGINTDLVVQLVAMDSTFSPAGTGVTIEIPAGTWTNVSVPLSDLGTTTSLGGIWWQAIGGADPSPFHLDDVVIAGPQPDPTPSPDPTTPPAPTPTTQPDPTPTAQPTAPPDPTPTSEPEPDPTPTAEPDPTPQPEPAGEWAFEETFDGDPPAPSQELLPDDFEFVATHRSHPGEHFSKTYTPFLVDHAENCAGPNPEVSPLPQRLVETRQDTNGSNPDETFFICKNHMMSAMGDVEGYSISSFWPRQDFDFSDGGTVEFEVNINDAHAVRSWWEVMIVPRDQLKVGAGPIDSPISETYPHDRIVLDFRRNVRTIKVGTGALAPDGWLANETQRGQWDWAWWRDLHPDDPALDDRRVRRTMRITFGTDRIDWAIETADGSFDTWSVDVPGGLPFDQGLVLFKTHAYNPTKDGNLDTYTFHWDTIRFDGPVVGRYDVHEADDVVYLQRNGDRQIGEQETVTIDLPADLGANPVLFGQLHQPKTGQVLLSINGGPDVAVNPYQYDIGDCYSETWKSFRLELDPAQLQPGENTLTWTIGPRPDCVADAYLWDGFSAKFLQIQTDAVE